MLQLYFPERRQSVKTRQGLTPGTTIFNRAGIYFDDNPVVMTNTVEDIKGGCFANTVSSVKPARNVEIFPNPATNELTIQLPDQSFSTFTVTNSIGQEMLHQPLTQTSAKFSISKLPAGLYYITFRGDVGTEVRKFSKL